jgi:hypothetical protein
VGRKIQTISELDEFKVTEERLAKRLGVKEFRLPPDFRDPGQGVTNPSLKIPFERFHDGTIAHDADTWKRFQSTIHTKPTCTGVYLVPEGHVQKFLKTNDRD